MDRFSSLIIIRVLLIVSISLVFGIVFVRTDYLFSQLILGIILAGLALEMIRFAKKANRELFKFILAIKYGDVSVNFSGDRLGDDFKELVSAFRDVIQAYQKVKIEKESQYQLLQAIIDQISFGLIAFNEEHEILLINKSALNLLKIEKTKDWNLVMKHRPDFTHQLEHMSRDGRKLIEFVHGAEIEQFSVYNHEIVLLEKQCRVITFYDIQAEIEQKEIEAWYKLIRILTHEIMNSTTPLISLTETILMLLEDQKGNQKSLNEITNQNIRDVRFSVNTIKNRSEGILKFVEAYRKLTDIPHPEFHTVPLVELFHSTTSLFEAELKKRRIRILVKVEPDSLCLFCDSSLMDQVFINLISNSMHALDVQKEPVIRINAFESHSRITIIIEDNGKGIDPDILQKIFIPFFSTREGGSGIGLSFSKFVILQHGGRIKMESRKNEFTKCIIDLPKE